MTLRTVIARDMPDALRRAKARFGDDAILLDSRPIGQHLAVRVTNDPSYLANSEQRSRLQLALHQPLEEHFEQTSAHSATIAAATTDTGPAPADDSPLVTLLQQLREFSTDWRQNFGNGGDSANAAETPFAYRLLEMCTAAGLATELAAELVQQQQNAPALDTAWRRLLIKLRSKLNISDIDLAADEGVFAFVGPSAAGKTTVLGKLATAYLDSNSAKDLALVSMDQSRLGSYQQLRAYSDMLGVDLHLLDPQDGSIATQLAELADKRKILIDTASLGESNARFTQTQLSSISRDRPVHTVLVLPADLQFDVMQQTAQCLQQSRQSSCVFTRLDECDSYGAMISLLASTGLPVAATNASYVIPGDLPKPDSLGLISLLLSASKLGADATTAMHAEVLRPESDRQAEML